MLTLSRHPQESVKIGPDIRVVVLNVEGKRVRLGFEAPPETVVAREEIENFVGRLLRPQPEKKPTEADALRRELQSTQELLADERRRRVDLEARVREFAEFALRPEPTPPPKRSAPRRENVRS